MADYPEQGSTNWGEPLKEYIDDSGGGGGGDVSTVAGVSPIAGDIPTAALQTALDLPADTATELNDLSVDIANEATTARNADNLTSGEVADARIPSTIARDSEVILKSLIDAKGDLIVGTGADAVDRLPAGTDGYVLMAASAETSGFEWAIPEGLEGLQGPPGVPGPIGTQRLDTHTSGTYTLDPTAGTDYVIYLEGDIDFAIQNMAAGQSLYVRLIQKNGGGHEATFPAAVAGGDDIVLSPTLEDFDVLIVWEDRAGTCVKLVQSGSMPVDDAFTPDQLTNQKAWFEGDQVSDTLLGLETLAWGNLFAGQADMTAPNGAGTGPIVRSEGGFKYLEFDGSNDYLESTFGSISPPFTIAMVVRVNEATAKTPVLNGPNLGNTEVFMDGTSPTRTWRVNSLNATTLTYTGVWRTILVHVKNAADGYVRADGVQFDGSTGGAALVGIRLGRVEAASSNYGQIDLASLIVLTKTPAGTDVADIETYMNEIRDALNEA